MASQCAVCGKGPQFGQNIRHVHSGSWALRAPRTKRRWLPNLQSARVLVAGESRRIRVCTKCLKAGKVAKYSPAPSEPVEAAPPRPHRPRRALRKQRLLELRNQASTS